MNSKINILVARWKKFNRGFSERWVWVVHWKIHSHLYSKIPSKFRFEYFFPTGKLQLSLDMFAAIFLVVSKCYRVISRQNIFCSVIMQFFRQILAYHRRWPHSSRSIYLLDNLKTLGVFAYSTYLDARFSDWVLVSARSSVCALFFVLPVTALNTWNFSTSTRQGIRLGAFFVNCYFSLAQVKWQSIAV